jgi:hypothetical protein
MDFTKLAAYLDSFKEDDPNYPLVVEIKSKIAQDQNDPTSINNTEDDELSDTDVTSNSGEQRSSENIEGELMNGAFQELDAQNQIDEEKEEVNMVETPQEISNAQGPVQKVASAFIRDVMIKDLPEKVRNETYRFVPGSSNAHVIHYGMVCKELLPKVDKANFTVAEGHVSKLPKKELDKNKLLNDMKLKYIFLLNDKVVDGHHFLAKIKAAGITSSLNVLDLTPARIHTANVKKASLFSILQQQLKQNGNNNRR